jgi:hypothetical protein
LKDHIDRVRPHAPYRRNRQLVIHIVDAAPPRCAFEIAKALNDSYKTEPRTLVNGREVFAQADAPSHVRERRAAVAKAVAAVKQTLPNTWKVCPDWPAGAVYAEQAGHDILLGTFKNGGWEWSKNLDATFGNGTTNLLTDALLTA